MVIGSTGGRAARRGAYRDAPKLGRGPPDQRSGRAQGLRTRNPDADRGDRPPRGGSLARAGRGDPGCDRAPVLCVPREHAARPSGAAPGAARAGRLAGTRATEPAAPSRRGARDRVEVVLRGVPRARRGVRANLLGTRRPRDYRGDARDRGETPDRELEDAAAALGAYALQRLNGLEVALVDLPSGQPRARGRRLAAPVLPREEPAREREVRHVAHAVAQAEREHLGVVVAVEEAVLVLDGDDRDAARRGGGDLG